MKEYLVEINGVCRIVWDRELVSWRIEIPDGAEILTVICGDDVFYKSGRPFQWFNGVSKKWMDCSDLVVSHDFGDALWKREKESLNDKVASAEEFRKESIVDFPEFKHSIDATLAERQKQYGCFEDVAHVTQGMIALMRQCGYDGMPASHQMALSMIASKMARIVNGDYNHKDSWHDIGGYAKLIENLIGNESEMPF